MASEAFVVEFFADLPLLSPGTDDDTRAVLDRIAGDLPPFPTVAEFGCGTGRSAFVVADRFAGARIVAVDRAARFLACLGREAAARGLSHRVCPVQGDMMRPPLAPGSVDLIWCEGAVYNVGLGDALPRWRPLLAPGGLCVVSDCEWLTADRPRRAEAFWRASYPPMADRAENLRRIERAGFQVLATHLLSTRGWEDYYRAVGARLARERPRPETAGFLDGLSRERSVYADSRGSYGYVFYLLKPDARS